MAGSLKQGVSSMNPWALHLQELGLELKCPLCLEFLKRPFLLPCDHIFCNSCLPKTTEFGSECSLCKAQHGDSDLRCLSMIENMVTIYRSLDSSFSASILQSHSETARVLKQCPASKSNGSQDKKLLEARCGNHYSFGQSKLMNNDLACAPSNCSVGNGIRKNVGNCNVPMHVKDKEHEVIGSAGGASNDKHNVNSPPVGSQVRARGLHGPKAFQMDLNQADQLSPRSPPSFGDNKDSENDSNDQGSDDWSGNSLRVKRLSENAVLSSRGSPLSAGCDLSSVSAAKVPARGKALIPTDLSIVIPEGTYARIAPGSGLTWKHSIDVGAGVIDADYRGPVGVILFNHSDVDFELKVGDRMAQLIVEKIVPPNVVEVEDLDATVRGVGGFGNSLRVKRLSENAVLPSRGSPLSAGCDLSSVSAVKVPARGKALIPTDLSIAIPEGTYARIAPRSGLTWKHSIDVGGGVIDADYRGPVGVILCNHSDVDFEVKVGDRIAQIIIQKIMTPNAMEVEDLDATVRGAGGFGNILRVKRLSENAVLPSRGSPLSAGCDLSSVSAAKVPARGKALIPTDLSIAIPEGTYACIAPKSRLTWKHSIDVGGGVIDADYRGLVGVILCNHSDVDFEVKVGDRIAQIIIQKIMTPNAMEVEDLDATVRGAGGFGSTGVRACCAS